MNVNRVIVGYSYVYLLLFTWNNANQINEELSHDETRLIQLILNETTYLKKVRPSNKVIVDIRLIFNQIISMVEKEQIIVTNCFVDQKWTGNDNEHSFQELFIELLSKRSSSRLESR